MERTCSRSHLTPHHPTDARQRDRPSLPLKGRHVPESGLTETSEAKETADQLPQPPHPVASRPRTRAGSGSAADGPSRLLPGAQRRRSRRLGAQAESRKGITPTSGFSQSPDRRKQASERSAEAHSSQREEPHSVYLRNARGLHSNSRAQHGSPLGACAAGSYPLRGRSEEHTSELHSRE